MDARWLWLLLFSGSEGTLQEPACDYNGMLDRMEAAELLSLMEKVQERLRNLGVEAHAVTEDATPVNLFIDKNYNIRMERPEGPALPFRPLVKALFILFLKHPEGIVLKQRERYTQELECIYSVIAPGVSPENRGKRVRRLMDIEDNSFSEKLSVLNASMDKLLPQAISDSYKVHGYNGHPRRIPLPQIYVHWEK